MERTAKKNTKNRENRETEKDQEKKPRTLRENQAEDQGKNQEEPRENVWGNRKTKKEAKAKSKKTCGVEQTKPRGKPSKNVWGK